MRAEQPLPLTAVMGTINEAENLRLLLPRLSCVVREIVVVDDGSSDGSRDVARRFGAVVVERPCRMGIGSAVYAGVNVASQEFVAVMDSDGSHPPEVLRVAAGLLNQGTDIVKFSRFLPSSRVNMAASRWLILRLYGAVFGALCGFRLSDPTNGFLVARRECFDSPTAFRSHPGEGWVAEFLAENRRCRIREIPYHHAARQVGTSHFGFRRELERAVRSLTLGCSRRRGRRDLQARSRS